MVTKLDLNGTLIAFTDLGAAPTTPSFGGGIYLNGGIFYQRLASGVIGTLTNAGGTPGTVSSVTVLAPLPGLSVAGNNITTEGTIIITGTLTHGAGGTGLGATPTNGQVLIGNGAGYTLGTLTAGAGMGITNSAGGISIASTEWTSTGTLTHLVTSTRNVTVGGATDIAKFGVIGDTDEVQARIRANATQSNYLALFEDSAGNAQVAIGGNGDFISNEEGNDADFRVEGDTDTHLIYGDAGQDAAGVGATSIDGSAKFQIDSTTKGFLPPRQTTAQRTGIGTPADGLVVYDTDLDALYLRANGAWVALGTGTGSTLLDFNGFRLTPTTATPVVVGNVANATSIYWTPFLHNLISLYNGSTWDTLASAELTVSLAALTADTNYDIFIYNNSGTVAVDTLVAWTNATTRATALVRQDGRWCKTGALTRRYVGTIRISGTVGELDWTPAPSAAVGSISIWNMENRIAIPFRLIDTTDSWSYGTATWRQANASTNNQVNVVVGLAESEIGIDLSVIAVPVTNNAAAAIGEDATNARATENIGITVSALQLGNSIHFKKIVPLGYHFYAWLEIGNGGAVTWFGDNGASDTFQSGMSGRIVC